MFCSCFSIEMQWLSLHTYIMKRIHHCLAIVISGMCRAVHNQFEPHVRKPTFWHVRPTKTQISLRMRTVWLEYSLSAWRNFASLAIQIAPSEDSDQTARMRRLIWIFAGRTYLKVRFLTLRLIWSVWTVTDRLLITAYSFTPSHYKYQK